MRPFRPFWSWCRVLVTKDVFLPRGGSCQTSYCVIAERLTASRESKYSSKHKPLIVHSHSGAHRGTIFRHEFSCARSLKGCFEIHSRTMQKDKRNKNSPYHFGVAGVPGMKEILALAVLGRTRARQREVGDTYIAHCAAFRSERAQNGPENQKHSHEPGQERGGRSGKPRGRYWRLV